MQLRSQIEAAIADAPGIVTPEAVAGACSSLGLSATAFCDLFAKEVTKAYLDGTIGWSDGDAAMNALSGYFFVHLPKDVPFPDYAFGAFLAFDAGEALEEPDNERTTKQQLAALQERA